jgi:hypothetical protein
MTLITPSRSTATTVSDTLDRAVDADAKTSRPARRRGVLAGWLALGAGIVSAGALAVWWPPGTMMAPALVPVGSSSNTAASARSTTVINCWSAAAARVRPSPSTAASAPSTTVRVTDRIAPLHSEPLIETWRGCRDAAASPSVRRSTHAATTTAPPGSSTWDHGFVVSGGSGSGDVQGGRSAGAVHHAAD